MAIIGIIAAITLLFLLKDNHKHETVYSGSESNISEAIEYYWLLKNNQIAIKYEIPYNWENVYRFGYKESPIYIKVREEDAEKARKMMMYYRAEKRQMQRNLEADRRGG